ncbi:bifunctional serine/threonine-protein kinase/formylglycine-generating enzyme family protein [Lignipirellula cremea]|uniref:Serine/threonine-protein kinase PknB n=1 Tax=Lignipirellula cremea TaxID=2528010 RepID=A0A518E2D3_9BACT|nr:bifunctional serine/threonine-protein kinase/formylglycine-generating enzyme family protein [Lignipirellula cremea]QDU98258.1 Serine/threonine-protein kinase PknB [Lignipirellula cremea]
MSGVTEGWVGKTLGRGRYRVENKLGEGGMGLVFLAHDEHLEHRVVIKAPRAVLLEDAAATERFAREIRSMVRLEHPHIVRVLDVGEHAGLPFAVMQYLAGGSLEDRREDFSSPQSVLRWIPQIASALDFVHVRGFVHRDVKPANILFDAYGNVFLSDFGIAKGLCELRTDETQAGSLTGAGMIIGTPHYMAPELVRCESINGRVDQYALAATVYELLSGQKLFEGTAPSALLVKQVIDAPTPLHETASHVSVAFSQVISRALEKSPERRFPSCHDLELALRTALGKPAPFLPSTAVSQPTGDGLQDVDPDDEIDLDFELGPLPETKKSQEPTPENPSTQIPRLVKPAPLPPAPTRVFSQEAAPSPPTPPNRLRRTNAIGMGFARVEPGEFWKALDPSDAADEGRQVCLADPFWIGIHQVTVGQFQKFVDETGYATEAQTDGQGGFGRRTRNGPIEGPSPQFHWKSVGWFQSGAHPVVNVTATDVAEFCVWLRRVDSRRYRLPTEDEWEYACRAGGSGPFFGGESLSLERANFNGAAHSKEASVAAAPAGVLQKSAAVGSYPPNDWGLYDMHGNIWEWTVGVPSGSGTTNSRAKSPAGEPLFALRGGAWDTAADHCRSEVRKIRPASFRHCSTGFRLVSPCR